MGNMSKSGEVKSVEIFSIWKKIEIIFTDVKFLKRNGFEYIHKQKEPTIHILRILINFI